MKKLISLVLAALLVLSLCAFAETTGDTEGVQANAEWYEKADFSVLQGKKLGITIQSLQNAYWAGVMTALGECLEAAGAEYTIVACDDSSATQIGQIENFISAGCDLIMVHPSDAAAVEDVCAEAREKGIKVMCWDDPMENTDANWILDNTYLGTEIGKLAGAFINEHYSEDNKAEVIVIGYPQTKILLEREEGIMAGLAEVADGKYEIVANQAGIIASDAQTAVETTLQAHPNAKVVAGIGAGAMIGADEALNIYTNGEIPEDMGVFTTDVTKQQLEQLEDPTYPAKGIIGFEGSDEDTARSCAAMYALILADNVGAQNVFRGVTPITGETVAEIIAGMK
ncbi:MAG: sugar ABC transporter substrate-binding protein [Clostridia bacterium]|nr:sugar ABC transporter substrate-binding protein [Clostridia bacterium]